MVSRVSLNTMAYHRFVSKLIQPVCRRLFQVSYVSTSTKFGLGTDLHFNPEEGYATLFMKSAPANALSSSFMDELSSAIDTVESSTCRALILTSSVKNIFSSGLDLNELAGSGTSLESSKKYYNLFQDLWLKLFKTPLVTIAAINGHAIAAGCGLAIACDYRVLAAPKFGIGITSALLGIPMPLHLLCTIQNVTGWQTAAKSSSQAKIFTGEDALSVGLVDEIADVDKVLELAQKQVIVYLKTNDRARTATKLDTRENMIARFKAAKERDLDSVAAVLQDADRLKNLLFYIESVKSRKK